MKHYILTSLFGFGIFAISAQTKLPNPGKPVISVKLAGVSSTTKIDGLDSNMALP